MTGATTETPAGPVTVIRTGLTAVEQFTVFAQVSGPALFRVAYLLCGDAHRAQDLVQLALERTYRAWGRVGDGDPFAYARRVLATARIDGWRRTRRETVGDALAHAQGSVPDAAQEVAERDRLVRALRELTVKQRRVVVLRYLLDRTEAETADELGIAVGTVKSTAARGLARLRTLLAPDAGGETWS